MPPNPKDRVEVQRLNPRDNAHHDVLVTTPITDEHRQPRLYRFIVDRNTGAYNAAPIELKPDGKTAQERLGERKAHALAEYQEGSGIAFATLPVKDEPASSAVCCYLINRQLLNYTTAWTRAPWNDHPDPKDAALPEDQKRFAHARVREEAPNPEPRFLVALSNGEVLDIRVGEDTPSGRLIATTPLDLRRNPDAWRLLRNGCVAGVAALADGTRLRLFNLDSIHVTAPAQRGEQLTHLTGTLDFKWRPGQTIHVCFAPYDPKNAYDISRADLITRIKELACGWLEAVNLTVEFHDVVRTDYDILVNFEPLDGHGGKEVTIGDGVSEYVRPVLFPMSQLGSYAERTERGEPTMFLGYPKGLLDANGALITRDRYVQSDVFVHVVLHEFGHALGLPHLHQHPGITNPFGGQEPEVLVKEIKSQLGISVNEEFVREELQGRWPGFDYSEWPAIAQGEDPEKAVDRWLDTSVMFGLPNRALLRGKRNCKLTMPALGDTDREWIRLLYPLPR